MNRILGYMPQEKKIEEDNKGRVRHRTTIVEKVNQSGVTGT